MKFITKKELATRYSVCERTVDSWMRRLLPYVKVGGVVRFNAEECDQALAKFRRNAKRCERDTTLGTSNVAEEAACESNEQGHR